LNKDAGINSKLFGSGASYKSVGSIAKGILNSNSVLRVGWTKVKNVNVFRIAVGPAPKYAVKMNKYNPIRYMPHGHIFERRW
jgi:hypothetical protein